MPFPDSPDRRVIPGLPPNLPPPAGEGAGAARFSRAPFTGEALGGGWREDVIRVRFSARPLGRWLVTERRLGWFRYDRARSPTDRAWRRVEASYVSSEINWASWAASHTPFSADTSTGFSVMS